jgi:hypothetical protein
MYLIMLTSAKTNLRGVIAKRGMEEARSWTSTICPDNRHQNELLEIRA